MPPKQRESWQLSRLLLSMGVWVSCRVSRATSQVDGLVPPRCHGGIPPSPYMLLTREPLHALCRGLRDLLSPHRVGFPHTAVEIGFHIRVGIHGVKGNALFYFIFFHCSDKKTREMGRGNLYI